MTKKNYKLILVVSIGMILAVVLLTSYALWRVKDGQTLVIPATVSSIGRGAFLLFHGTATVHKQEFVTNKTEWTT